MKFSGHERVTLPNPLSSSWVPAFYTRDRISDDVKLFGSALTLSPNHVAKGVSMPPLQSVFLRGLQLEDSR